MSQSLHDLNIGLISRLWNIETMKLRIFETSRTSCAMAPVAPLSSAPLHILKALDIGIFQKWHWNLNSIRPTGWAIVKSFLQKIVFFFVAVESQPVTTYLLLYFFVLCVLHEIKLYRYFGVRCAYVLST